MSRQTKRPPFVVPTRLDSGWRSTDYASDSDSMAYSRHRSRSNSLSSCSLVSHNSSSVLSRVIEPSHSHSQYKMDDNAIESRSSSPLSLSSRYRSRPLPTNNLTSSLTSDNMNSFAPRQLILSKTLRAGDANIEVNQTTVIESPEEVHYEQLSSIRESVRQTLLKGHDMEKEFLAAVSKINATLGSTEAMYFNVHLFRELLLSFSSTDFGNSSFGPEVLGDPKVQSPLNVSSNVHDFVPSRGFTMLKKENSSQTFSEAHNSSVTSGVARSLSLLPSNIEIMSLSDHFERATPKFDAVSTVFGSEDLEARKMREKLQAAAPKQPPRGPPAHKNRPRPQDNSLPRYERDVKVDLSINSRNPPPLKADASPRFVHQQTTDRLMNDSVSDTMSVGNENVQFGDHENSFSRTDASTAENVVKFLQIRRSQNAISRKDQRVFEQRNKGGGGKSVDLKSLNSSRRSLASEKPNQFSFISKARSDTSSIGSATALIYLGVGEKSAPNSTSMHESHPSSNRRKISGSSSPYSGEPGVRRSAHGSIQQQKASSTVSSITALSNITSTSFKQPFRVW